MKSIEIEVKDSYNDKQNLIVKIDGKEVGILYIDEDQKFDLLKILRRGKDEDTELIEPQELDDLDEDGEEY
jgi:hypothetical protein